MTLARLWTIALAGAVLAGARRGGFMPEPRKPKGETKQMTDRILIIQARRPGNTTRLPSVVRHTSQGWRFAPLVSGRKHSAKAYPIWEAALPRWTGGLSRTESIRIEPGETIMAALGRFPAVPEFERPA